MATTKIDGMKVACTRKVKASQADQVGTDVAWTFDFTGCPEASKLELATRSLVIDMQGTYRNAKPNVRKSLINKTFLVSDLLAARKRKPKAPPTVAEVKSAMAGLTEVERQEIMAEHIKK